MDKRNTPRHTGTLPFEVVTEHSQYQSDMESAWTLVYSELAYCTGIFFLVKQVFLFTYFLFIGQGTNCTYVNHTQRSQCGFSLKYFIFLQYLDMAFVYTSGSHGDDYAPLCGLPHIMPLHVRSYSSYTMNTIYRLCLNLFLGCTYEFQNTRILHVFYAILHVFYASFMCILRVFYM